VSLTYEEFAQVELSVLVTCTSATFIAPRGLQQPACKINFSSPGSLPYESESDHRARQSSMSWMAYRSIDPGDPRLDSLSHRAWFIMPCPCLPAAGFFYTGCCHHSDRGVPPFLAGVDQGSSGFRSLTDSIFVVIRRSHAAFYLIDINEQHEGRSGLGACDSQSQAREPVLLSMVHSLLWHLTSCFAV